MAKIYPSSTSFKKSLKPRKETLQFLLDFSKSYQFYATKQLECEVILN